MAAIGSISPRAKRAIVIFEQDDGSYTLIVHRMPTYWQEEVERDLGSIGLWSGEILGAPGPESHRTTIQGHFGGTDMTQFPDLETMLASFKDAMDEDLPDMKALEA